MAIRPGDVITHCEANEWGVGRVVEVSPGKVTIHFNDGVIRKIMSSYIGSLLPAEATLFLPVVPEVPKVGSKSSSSSKGQKKAKR